MDLEKRYRIAEAIREHISSGCDFFDPWQVEDGLATASDQEVSQLLKTVIDHGGSPCKGGLLLASTLTEIENPPPPPEPVDSAFGQYLRWKHSQSRKYAK